MGRARYKTSVFALLNVASWPLPRKRKAIRGPMNFAFVIVFMEYTPISPFKRPISHAQLQVIDASGTDKPGKPVNKWEILRDLSKAQAAFGVSERDLTVLQGLLSFFPNDTLGEQGEMIVFPSNKAICERLNGMACSTMRRHLARLVEARLVIRRDSPNGKRYIRRHGDARIAFGFDLSPLYRKAADIAHAAEAAREAESRKQRLRVIVSLMRRDLAAMAEYGKENQPELGAWDQFCDTAVEITRALRRKLSLDELLAFRARLEACLNHARDIIDGIASDEMITNDAQFERHHHNSKKDLIEFEHHSKKTCPEDEVPETTPEKPIGTAKDAEKLPRIPLRLVLDSCPTIKSFYQGDIRHWHQLFDAACHIRPAMGITVSAWEEAQRIMGPEQAAIVVVAMLERFSEIRSPGGYLRALSSKAATGGFSCGPMVMALLNRKNAA